VAAKTIASILLAYPLSGAIYAIVGLIKLAFTTPASLKNIGVDFFMIALWTVMVPAGGGFVPQNEGDVGPRINMYPWIIPTAVTLFVLFSKGWRWFRRANYLPDQTVNMPRADAYVCRSIGKLIASCRYCGFCGFS
jgi:hypothetical protein